MSTKQLLIGIFAFVLCTVGILTLLFTAYTVYKGQVCQQNELPTNVAGPVSPSPEASPSATPVPTETIKRIILVTPTPARKVVPVVSPVVSPAQ